jgi:hypothetical protein
MDWGNLVGPAVVAASVSGAVTIVGFFVNRSISLKLHQEKIDADRRLAERKVEADTALAERKFNLDQLHALQNRRFELAEAVLSDAYRFRDTMAYVRNGFAFDGEGLTRQSAATETDSLKNVRNSYFVPVERLQANNEFISTLMARQHAAHSLFGPDARKAFELFGEVMHRVRVASSMLIEMSGQHGNDKELSSTLRADVWAAYGQHKNGDQLGQKIDEALELIERFCRPALERKITAV